MSKTRSRTGSRSSTKPADYVSIAIAYAETACEDRKGASYGKWVRLAARRFLDDLKRKDLKNPPFGWSADRANHVCGFVESLPHVEGTWPTETIKLDPSQCFFLCNLFGFRRADGARRFTAALYAVARKNGKSSLGAAVLLYCLAEEAEVGPQLLSAATTGDQARIVWGIAKRMVEKSPELREFYSIEAFANSIARYTNGGTLRPINAKASTQDGLNPSALCFDEIHAHKTRDLYDVLRSATGSRKNPLFLYTTTEGFETPGPWPEIRTFAQQVLQGIVEADHFFAVYYALDEDDDNFDESKWVKANPLLGVSVTLDKLREYATEAKQQPGALAEFQIKRLNRRAAAANTWIDLLRWKKCNGPVDLKAMEGLPCWGGLDLASTTDIAAWRLLWRKGDHYYTWGRFWVPQGAVAQRNERGTVRYSNWVASGHMTVIEGDTTDYNVVQADLLTDIDRFKPRTLAYDSWNATQLANSLMGERPQLKLERFHQGPQSYHPAMLALERAYIGGNFSHGDNPVLTWMAANLVPARDSNMNMKPDRKRSADKIDGMAALLMAFGVAIADQTAEKKYDIFFLGR